MKTSNSFIQEVERKKDEEKYATAHQNQIVILRSTSESANTRITWKHNSKQECGSPEASIWHKGLPLVHAETKSRKKKKTRDRRGSHMSHVWATDFF